jgi:signal transduction histidine kinase
LRIYNENIEYGYHDINDIESECLVIEADSKIVIIDFGYPTAHRFANKYLNKRFSYPEAMYIYIFAMTSIVFLLLYLRKSGRTLSIEVEKMLTVTKQVENHNLDFEVPSSCYAEVDKVLSSMDQMRAALVDSLKAQWDIEEERIKQIAELAHDIKTPLTVIRGNAELLQDCGLSQKQNLYNSYILKSAAILESYLMKLREYIHKIDIILDYTVVNLDSFWQELVGLLKSMSQSTKLQVLQSMDYHYAQIHIDPNAVKRAFLNMFENAVLYSAEDDCLSFMLEVNENECRFILENKVSASRIHTPMKIDSMIGWKDSMLAGHGLGVSIAKSIVESHGGKLLYEIDENRGSGVVEIKLPLYKTNASSDVNL